MDTFLLQSIQKSSGAHQATHAMGTDGSFQEVEQLRHEVDHSPQPSAKSMKKWSYISTPPYTSMVCTRTNLTSHFTLEKQGVRV
jgi:hypothetical protein